MPTEPDQPPETAMRLDKWLWCARFFKTRQLSAAAVRTAKVTVNGSRARPSRQVRAGERLRIDKKGLVFEVDVLALAGQRLSAPLAAGLYRETRQSIVERERQQKIHRQDRLSRIQMQRHKPDKRQRRILERFKRGAE